MSGSLELLYALPRTYARGVVTKGDDGYADLRTNLGEVHDKADVRFVETGGFTTHVERLKTQLDRLLSDINKAGLPAPDRSLRRWTVADARTARSSDAALATNAERHHEVFRDAVVPPPRLRPDAP
jgi:hypothetical protein